MLSLKESNIIFLQSFLHTGLDWVHSLLDSHSEILIMPALSFYRCWTILDLENVKDKNTMFFRWTNYFTNYVGPNCKNEQKKILNTEKELKKFFFKLKECFESVALNKKTVFFSIYESYAYAKNIDLKKIKILICAEHLPWYSNNIKKEFPTSKVLMVVRDPRASLAGTWHRTKNIFKYLPDITFTMSIDCWIQGYKIINDKFYTLNHNLYIIQNEKVHQDIKQEMIKLSKWLKINFEKSLLNSTFPSGKPVYVDSAYLMKDKKNVDLRFMPKPPIDFFKPENIKKRWMKELNKNQIIMIEYLFYKIFIKFNYDLIYKRSFINNIRGFLVYLFPQYELLKYWKRNFPNIEAFDRIENKLSIDKKNILHFIWIKLPSLIKLFILVLYSIFTRVNVLFSVYNRGKKYDQKLKPINEF